MGQLNDSALNARKIRQCARRVVGTPTYFRSKGVPKSPAALEAHEAIIYEQRPVGATWVFRRGTAEIPVTLRGRVRVSAAEGVREAVLAELGLTVASGRLFARELNSGAVKPVLEDWSLPPIDLLAVFPTGRQSRAKARAFTSIIEQEVPNVDCFGNHRG